jgi:sucrose phosphorylase
MSIDERIKRDLWFLYGERTGTIVWLQIDEILDKFSQESTEFQKKVIDENSNLTQKDVFLITYANQIREKNTLPLSTLDKFLNKYLDQLISGVHILPFFPYSSDDGFSVIDYYQVNPDYGDWMHISKIGKNFLLMIDAVINHISSRSEWFQAFVDCKDPYDDFFISVDPSEDLSEVVRPRDLPLLTKFETAKGEVSVWTTFSEDQIDLNYSNPDVLLEIIKVILFYVKNGADLLRLDAIAYLWKEIGTKSIHLPQTHSIIRIFRAVLDRVAPNVLLITETNVPHDENIRYFGKYLGETDRTDEAQLVYQFPLAPLILYTFHKGNTDILTNWVKDLSGDDMFFNFMASHDGIGVMPAKDLLNPDDIQFLVDHTKKHNGKVSYKTNADGSKSVYELNITLYDALNDPNIQNDELDIKRFLASQAIMLSLNGVPGIYFHSLFGLRNCEECVLESGILRSINREKFTYEEFEKKLSDPSSIHKKVFNGYSKLLRIRRKTNSFHPKSSQSVIEVSSSVFGLLRKSPDREEAIVSLINVTDQVVEFSLSLADFQIGKIGNLRELISGIKVESTEDDIYSIILTAYQIMWLYFQIDPIC